MPATKAKQTMPAIVLFLLSFSSFLVKNSLMLVCIIKINLSFISYFTNQIPNYT
jgi:type II secretory pathway component PulF